MAVARRDSSTSRGGESCSANPYPASNQRAAIDGVRRHRRADGRGGNRKRRAYGCGRSRPTRWPPPQQCQRRSLARQRSRPRPLRLPRNREPALSWARSPQQWQALPPNQERSPAPAPYPQPMPLRRRRRPHLAGPARCPRRWRAPQPRRVPLVARRTRRHRECYSDREWHAGRRWRTGGHIERRRD